MLEARVVVVVLGVEPGAFGRWGAPGMVGEGEGEGKFDVAVFCCAFFEDIEGFAGVGGKEEFLSVLEQAGSYCVFVVVVQD